MSDYIPHELLNEILTRLPVKSLLRFTAVCKSWYSLITNPNFIISHRNKTIESNKFNTQTLLVRDYDNNDKKEHYTLRRDDDTFGEPFLELEFPFKTALGYFRIVGSCNGMICLSDDLFGDMKSAVLWNPSIRKSVNIQMPSKPQLPHMIVLGFGVCPVSNETKIVRIVYLKKMWHDYIAPLEVQIFSLATGEWRNVSSSAPPYYIVEFTWSQALVNGIVHWIAYDKVEEGGFHNLVISFDMSNETFDEIMIPDELSGELVHSLSINVIGESLAVFNYNIEAQIQSCCIWVMKEYKVFESWTKLFSIDLVGLVEKTVRFRKNGEVLLVSKNNEVVSYDPNTQQIRDFGIVRGLRSFYVDNYMETLFLLKGENTNAEEVGVESSN